MRKEREVTYTELRGLLGNAEDYHVYHMQKTDYLIAWLIGFLIGMIILFAFFRSWLFSLAGAVVCAVIVPPHYNEYKKNRRLQQLRLQFRDLLESLTASYSAGRNTPDSFRDAWNDMLSIYGEDADIVQEVQIICAGLNNSINIEELLLDFARRSELDDIQSFANVFEVCNRQGGDLKRIVSETREIINDKIDVEMEIETMLSGNKNELYIMIVMPVVVVMSLSSMGGSTIVSNSLENVLVKILCLGILFTAYLIGKKIVDIKL